MPELCGEEMSKALFCELCMAEQRVVLATAYFLDGTPVCDDHAEDAENSGVGASYRNRFLEVDAVRDVVEREKK